MSQLLDSLRRVAADDRRAAGAPWRPTPDLILARMGYAADTRGVARALVLIAAAGVLVALGWAAIALRPQDGTVSPPARLPASGRPASASSPDSGAPVAPPPPAGTSAAPAPMAVAAQPSTTEPTSPEESAAQPETERTLVSSARLAFAEALEHERAGRRERAAAAYRQLIGRGELVPAAHNNLGLLLQAGGDLEGAAREFEAALRRDPAYARAHNNLGVVLLAQGRPLEAAERFTLAADLDPRDAGALVNLALAERDAGLPERAKESLLRALVLSPDSAAAHYNLAVLFDRSGEPGRAAQHYRAFLEHAGAEHAARAPGVRARLEALERTR